MKTYFFAVLLTGLMLAPVVSSRSPAAAMQKPGSPAAPALDLIRLQRYNDAINRLEQILEARPTEPDALTYLATAQMYADKDFLKAQKSFEAAFQAGGGAAFFVSHSHEKMGGNDLVDYCRGWLHLRKSGVRFVPAEGEHGFDQSYSSINEVGRNRFAKTLFHIKYSEKSQNFRGRTGDESEALLVVALYKKFAR